MKPKPTAPAKARTDRSRAALARDGGARLEVLLDAQGVADLEHAMAGPPPRTKREAVLAALRAFAGSKP